MSKTQNLILMFIFIGSLVIGHHIAIAMTSIDNIGFQTHRHFKDSILTESMGDIGVIRWLIEGGGTAAQLHSKTASKVSIALKSMSDLMSDLPPKEKKRVEIMVNMLATKQRQILENPNSPKHIKTFYQRLDLPESNSFSEQL